jgi:2-amino-4-hydroxy-6-hydroxymethyldihydropteridine diphosphokinase
VTAIRAETAFIAFGSNLGDREGAIRSAAALLARAPGVESLRLSALRETAPSGGPPQPPYLNAAAEVRTTLEPEALLDLLASVEGAFGRVRGVRWGPRTLDLDLIYFGGRVLDSPRLTVPHPRAAGRRFVLEPLAELAPDFIDPVSGRSVAELLEALG